MTANTENGEFTYYCGKANEGDQTTDYTETITQTTEEDTTKSPSFGDEWYFLDEYLAAGNTSSSCQDTRMMDEKISSIEKQLQDLLDKADEFQTQLLWSRDSLQDYGFAEIVPKFLQTCQPYFTLLESTARNSIFFCLPQPTKICTQLLQFSQQLCSRLEELVLLFASFNFCSLEESDPLSISHFYIGQFQINNMKVSIFRYCCPTPFLASSNTGLYKRMRWNVEREIEGADGERKTYDSAEFYFLCCEDVIDAPDGQNGESSDERESKDTDRESKVARIWSIGRWHQTFPDPNTEDIFDWVLCSVSCGQYKQLVCLGREEPSSCAATDCLLGTLLSLQMHGTNNITT